MQYGEEVLRFITRLLAEVSIWFRFAADTWLNIDVVKFCDDQRYGAGTGPGSSLGVRMEIVGLTLG
ncbi:hypothetical protein MJ905_26590 [Klebsiella michiganensis]|nr:hypothetical protein [Klebsiella michiganensis]UTX60752.1 hypothetical protein MJ905_26590 [Klebsiella michiganensis]